MTDRLTDEQLDEIGCQQCGGDLVPQDNHGNTVPRAAAVHLVCHSYECGTIWYNPAKPPLKVQQPDVVKKKLLPELREARALIAALKADGCPNKYLEEVAYCVWCEAVVKADGTIEHDTMHDGGPCLWVRIEQA